MEGIQLAGVQKRYGALQSLPHKYTYADDDIEHNDDDDNDGNDDADDDETPATSGLF